MFVYIQQSKLYVHVFSDCCRYWKLHNEYHQHVTKKDFTYLRPVETSQVAGGTNILALQFSPLPGFLHLFHVVLVPVGSYV